MRTTSLCLTLVLLSAVLLAGCSGSGVRPDDIAGTDTRLLASDHLSVIALLAGWLKTLYYRVPQGGSTTIEIDETLPDGTNHLKGTNSDGSTFEYWQAPDHSGYGSVTWNDMSVTETYGAPLWEPDHFHQEATQEWSTGLTLTVAVDADLSQLVPPQTWRGEANIADGSSMNYVLVRDPGLDRLTLNLPDGTTVQFQTQVAAVAGSAYWPQFVQGATASHSKGGRTLTYELKGSSDSWWDQMTFTSNAGITGAFVIDSEFVGSGQLRENGSVAGALGWDGQALGRLNLLGAGLEEVTPSAAARDFRLDQWANHVALMGPAPLY